ncbi:hypothetical protein [Aristophania vespae]|uniref:hypothetical protein n=1 Tax=Aristophania vespae TaxID=2697033 RepID=UPI001F220A8F|nr:hypothetical protein [Aristophania vespae]
MTNAMRFSFLFCSFVVGCSYITSQAEAEISLFPNAEQVEALPEQWYTGTLFAPSPALTDADSYTIEPYVSVNVPKGAYNSSGTLKKNHAQTSVSQFTASYYGITDQLTLYASPAYSYSWGDHSPHSGVKFNDLPVELQYRLTSHETPSVTVYLGFDAPLGSYSNLGNANEGVGTGVWDLRYGVQAQVVYPFFQRVMRIRMWAAATQPLSSVRLRNISSYGTETGFKGRGYSAQTGNEGFSLEFGLTKRWVFALDLYHEWSASSEVKGIYRQTKERYYSRTGWSGLFNVGPALEYGWSPDIGAIAGVILPVAGHNASRDVQAQCAVFVSF